MGKAPSGSLPESVYASTAPSSVNHSFFLAHHWGWHTGMANTRVVDLNSDFVGLWGCDLDGLDAQVLSCLPRNRSLSKTRRYSPHPLAFANEV